MPLSEHIKSLPPAMRERGEAFHRDLCVAFTAGAETTGVELRTRLDGVFAQWHNALASNNQSGGARVYAEESYIELYIVTASSPDFTLTKTDGTWAFRGQDWYSSYPSVVRPDQMADYVTQHAFEMAAWQNA